MKYHNVGNEIGYILVLCLVELAAGLLIAWFGVQLWNHIMVGVFSLPALTYWRFYGLMILLHILLPNRGVQRKTED